MKWGGVSGLMIGSDQVSQGESESARAFNASVLANAAEGILVVCEDGRIQYANPPWRRCSRVT